MWQVLKLLSNVDWAGFLLSSAKCSRWTWSYAWASSTVYCTRAICWPMGATAQQRWSSCVPVVYKGVTWGAGTSKSRNKTKSETKRKPNPHKFTTSTQAHHSTSIYGSIPCSLDSVTEVRLMVYSLLWQLSILLLTVLDFLPFSCMLTVDIFSS